MIKIEGTPEELEHLKNTLKLRTLCPFGVKDDLKRCFEYRDCEVCIETNIKWEEIK